MIYLSREVLFLSQSDQIITMTTPKYWLLVPLLVFIVMVSGCTEPTHDEIVHCETDSDCKCGLILGTQNCYVGNRNLIEPSDLCFSLCFGDSDKMIKCVSSECEWVNINPENPGEPVGELTYGAIKEEDNTTTVTVKNTGPVVFSPKLKLEIIRNDLSIFSTDIDFGEMALTTSLSKVIDIPERNQTGNWTYVFTLEDGQGNTLKTPTASYYKEPPPFLGGYTYFHIMPFYRSISNITVGVKNTGNLSFAPMVQMTIYMGDMLSVFSESHVYSNLEPNQSQIFDFVLPPIENRTYYFNFILSQVNTTNILEEITHEVRIGVWA